MNRAEHNAYRYDPSAPEFELPALWFNAGELYALLASAQLLESVQESTVSENPNQNAWMEIRRASSALRG